MAHFPDYVLPPERRLRIRLHIYNSTRRGEASLVKEFWIFEDFLLEPSAISHVLDCAVLGYFAHEQPGRREGASLLNLCTLGHVSIILSITLAIMGKTSYFWLATY